MTDTPIHLTVTIDSDDLRRWADWHADAGHHGVAHVLYQAANEAAGITAQHDAEVAAKALRDAADELEAVLGDSGPGNRTTGYGRAGLDLLAQLRARADRIEREATSE